MTALPTICVVFGVTGTKRRTSGLEDRFLLLGKTESCRFFGMNVNVHSRL